MAGLLERIERAQRRPLHAMTPAEARAAYERSAEVLDLPRAPLRRVQDLLIPATDGTPLRARLYTDTAASGPGLLYLHGGGFVVGSLETHDSLCRQLARRSGGAVLALDYRLAPEHRFPTAVDDAWAALRWLHAHAAEIGVDGPRCAGCTPMPRRSASTGRGSRSAATAPAARSRPSARCSRATTACGWRCSC